MGKGKTRLDKLLTEVYDAMGIDYTRKRAMRIPVDKLDCTTLIRLQGFGDCGARKLAWELALRIPGDKLDQEILAKFKESRDRDVCSLVRELELHAPV